MAPNSRVALAVLLLAAAPALGAQTNTERVLAGYDTPSRDFDVVHQRVEVGNFNWDSTAFDGRVTMTAIALAQRLDSVTLHMGRLLEVRSVSGAATGYRRSGDSIVVALGRTARFQDTVRFTIAYHGRVDGDGLFFFRADSTRPAQIYSSAGGVSRWIPTQGSPNDKMTWEVIATVPRDLTVVSNGRLVSDRPAGAQHTVHYALDRPGPPYFVALVIAPFAHLRDRWRDVPLDYFVYRADTARARAVFAMTPDVMEAYTRLTGIKYPWAKYAQITITQWFGGEENVSATTLVDWMPDRRAFLDRPWYTYSLIPHELAHQWFGNFVTYRDGASYWLSEGFATFMPGQYWGAKHGARAEDEYYFDQYRRFLASDAQQRMPLAAANSNVVYEKGALVLWMLEKYLGPERFWAGIHHYLEAHPYGNADNEDLRKAFLEATGENLAWFWSQWMYGAGYPEFAVAASYDSAASSVVLRVRQTQTDSAAAAASDSARRFTTPSVFRGPVTIRVGTAAGDVVAHARLDQRDQTIRVGGVHGAPTMVVFDDGNTLVKRLTFSQPTAWLATQLSRDTDLWDQWWAIQQLATRTTDTAAAAALGRSVRSAPDVLTRANAATALGGFGAAALPALEAAAHDTSARVRKAAVAALGAVGPAGTGRAVALVRSAWTSDSSYAVRAAALTAWARLDPSGSRTAVETGLQTNSYRDVIRAAARAAGQPAAGRASP